MLDADVARGLFWFIANWCLVFDGVVHVLLYMIIVMKTPVVMFLLVYVNGTVICLIVR